MKDKSMYNEILDEWLRVRKSGFAMSTYEKYRRICQKYIFPFFEKIDIREINADVLDCYRLFLTEKLIIAQASQYGDTAKCAAMLVNNGFDYAAELQLVDIAPHFILKSRTNHGEISIFTDEEQSKIESYCINNMDGYSFGVLLCLYTGLRIGELCALKWGDIDISEGVINIRRTAQRLKKDENNTFLCVSYPKTASSVRKIPIPDCIMEIVKDFWKGQTDDIYIFTNSPDLPAEPRTFQYRYRKYLEEAEVRYRKFHTLRHTFATRCISFGMDMKTLSEILGHSNVRITLEYYCHTTMEHKKEQMNRLFLLSRN